MYYVSQSYMLIAGMDPTGGSFQNPRSRNEDPQNKSTPTPICIGLGIFGGGGTLILRTQIPRTGFWNGPPVGSIPAINFDRRNTPGGFENPRSRNLLQPNKSTPTLFVPFWGGGTLIWLKQIP